MILFGIIFLSSLVAAVRISFPRQQESRQEMRIRRFQIEQFRVGISFRVHVLDRIDLPRFHFVTSDGLARQNDPRNQKPRKRTRRLREALDGRLEQGSDLRGVISADQNLVEENLGRDENIFPPNEGTELDGEFEEIDGTVRCVGVASELSASERSEKKSVAVVGAILRRSFVCARLEETQEDAVHGKFSGIFAGVVESGEGKIV